MQNNLPIIIKNHTKLRLKFLCFDIAFLIIPGFDKTSEEATHLVVLHYRGTDC